MDFAYGEELRIVKEKLKCEQNNGPNRWFYVSLNCPSEHVKLGLEEVMLWAQKLVSHHKCICYPTSHYNRETT